MDGPKYMCGVWVSVSVCAHEHAHTHVWHQCVASVYLIFPTLGHKVPWKIRVLGKVGKFLPLPGA